MTKINWQRPLLALGTAAALILCALALYGFDYSINDDVTMISILNGSYSGTPDAHAIFIGYPLTWLISSLYALCPAVSWYRVVMLVIYVLSSAFLLCRLFERFPRRRALCALLFAGVVALLWMEHIVRFTFTTCGAYVTGAVVLSYALMTREDDRMPSKLLPLLGLFWLSYCVRDYFSLAGLLLLGILWLGKYHDRLLREKQCWLIPLAGIAGLALCFGVHKLAYSSEEWSAFRAYNDMRSYVQDFSGIPSYDGHEEFYQSIGLSNADRKAIIRYRYMLTDSFGTDCFEEIYHYVSELEAQKEPEPLLRTLKRTLKTTVKHYLLCDTEDVGPLQAASIALPFLLLGCAIFCSVRRRRHDWVFPLLLLAGLGCMWLYICYEGRYPLRVARSLRILTVTASLAGFALLLPPRASAPERPGGASRPRVGYAAVLLASALLLGAGLGYTWQQAGRTEPYQRASYFSYADAHPENIYLRDTQMSMYGTEEHPSFNTLSTGGWLHYSPLYDQKLERMGLGTEVHRSTLLEDNVYLMAFASEKLYAVIGVSKNTPVEYEIVDTLEGDVNVYKIYSIGES